MGAKFHFLTDTGLGWPQLSPLAFDLTGDNKLPLVYPSQKYKSTGSSRFTSEAVVRGLSHPGQPVERTHDPHSLEFH